MEHRRQFELYSLSPAFLEMTTVGQIEIFASLPVDRGLTDSLATLRGG